MSSRESHLTWILAVLLAAITVVSPGCTSANGSKALIGTWAADVPGITSSGQPGTVSTEYTFYKDGTFVMTPAPGMQKFRWEATTEQDMPVVKITAAEDGYATKTGYVFFTWFYKVDGNRLLYSSKAPVTSENVDKYGEVFVRVNR